MIRALFKKQLMETFSMLFYNNKSKQKRSKGMLIAYSALFLYMFGFLGYLFYTFAESLIPLALAGYGWVYFAILSLIAVVLGVVGSVFTSYTGLYRSKDNDLLLSMPIPTYLILTVRLVCIYVVGLAYQLIVMIPMLIVYFMNCRVSPLSAIFACLLPLIVSVFVLTLSCAFGYVLAWINARLKHKNAVTVAAAILFMVGYYYVYSKMLESLQNVLVYSETLADTFKLIYPFYQIGLGAANGDVVAMLIGAAIFIGLFALTCWLLSHSFIKLATSNQGEVKRVYREKRAVLGSAKKALFKKEFFRLVSSPTYMLNCALGTVLMVAFAVILLIKGGDWISQIGGFLSEALIAMIALAALCASAAMNDLTAPSVSLEGKHIWLVQSLPVKAIDVLVAKLKLHLILTLIPAWILCAAVLVVLMPAWYYAVLIPIVLTAFIFLMALLGLTLNLLLPNLSWQNETIPVKQGLSVMLALFGGWVIVAMAGVAYWLLMSYVSAVAFVAVFGVLVIVASLLLWQWIRTRGASIFARLK